MRIVNLTQHLATPEQLAAGVVDWPRDEEDRATLARLLTFTTAPTAVEIQRRARALTRIAVRFRGGPPGTGSALIGGALFFMAPLERALRAAGITPIYAFSLRESVEESAPDGSVRKTATFRHVDFIIPAEGDVLDLECARCGDVPHPNPGYPWAGAADGQPIPHLGGLGGCGDLHQWVAHEEPFPLRETATEHLDRVAAGRS